MRNNLFSSILFIFLISTAFAQTDTTIFLKYFPLNDGDIWQYENRYYAHIWDTVEVVGYFTREVQGDTIMPNGFCYKKVTEGGYFRFFRVDTASLKVFEYFPGSCINDEIDILYLFGVADSTLETTNCRGAVAQVTLAPDSLLEIGSVYAVEEHYTLQKNLGIISYSMWEAGPPWTETLLAARINGIQTGSFVAVRPPITKDFSLFRTYPNPFNPILTIQYSLERAEPVQMTIYNLAGQLVEVLVDEPLTPGNYQIQWNGMNQPSGIYFLRLSVGAKNYFRKSVLLK
ncbi:MAG: T9SS type A sorting domain-containing protein [Candidatus Neomarinimicrobiota bacterium]